VVTTKEKHEKLKAEVAGVEAKAEGRRGTGSLASPGTGWRVGFVAVFTDGVARTLGAERNRRMCEQF
jgi:hypothetical protein